MGGQQQLACSRGGNASIGRQVSPLSLHGADQHISFRQEGDGTPLGWAPVRGVRQHLLQLEVINLCCYSSTTKCLSIPSSPKDQSRVDIHLKGMGGLKQGGAALDRFASVM